MLLDEGTFEYPSEEEYKNISPDCSMKALAVALLVSGYARDNSGRNYCANAANSLKLKAKGWGGVYV